MNKISAFGTALKRGAVEIAGVKSISGPGISVDTEDVTTHGQSHYWEEVIATIIRSGEITLDIVYDPADSTQKYAAGGLLHDLVSREAVTYSLVFPDTGTTTWTFDAFVTGFEPSAPVDGSLAGSVTLKPTGEMTLA